jgi:class 3 adenylate cyclase
MRFWWKAGFIILFVFIAFLPSFEKAPSFLAGIRDIYWQTLYKSGSSKNLPENIFVAGVTQEDLVNLGHWPWPRSRTIKIVENLVEKKPKSLTICFTSPTLSLNYLHLLIEASAKYPLLKIEESGLESYTDRLFWDVEAKIQKWLDKRSKTIKESSPSLINDFNLQRLEFLKTIKPSINEDNILYIQILCRFQNVCLQTIAVNAEEKEMVKERFPIFEQCLSSPAHPLEELGNRDIKVFESLPELKQCIPFFQEIRPCAKIEGIFEPIPETSSVIWQRKLLFRYNDKIYPSVELAAAALAFNAVPKIVWKGRNFALKINEMEVPVDSAGAIWIDYSNPFILYPQKSSGEILSQNLPSLEGKNVFFVQTTALAPHFPPSQRTPQGDFISQGQLIILGFDSLFNNHCFRPLNRFFNIVFPGVLLLILLFRAKKSFLLISIFGIFALLIFLISGLLLFRAKILVDPLPFTIWLILATGISAVFAYAGHLKEKKTLLNAFKHYLSPQVLKEVISHPELLTPGGQRKEITVLFCDIRNFTTLSEKHSPVEITQLLNVYLQAITECIFKNGGTIDKFIGDAIMAYFGAPLAQTDHPLRAVATALDMIETLETVKQRWRELGEETLSIGIGIHTGEAIVGNLGSKERFDYTVIGDTVNTAQRIEDATKIASVPLLVSLETKTKTEEHCTYELVGTFRLKGKSKPLALFTTSRS